MRLIDIAREVKHAQLVARRRLAPRLDPARDRVHRLVDTVRPFTYSDGLFPESFIAETPKVAVHESGPAPVRVFALWTGDNQMSVNRAAAFADLESRLPITLITPANLEEWVVPDAPLHPAYDHLSFVHRSDYLRAYLMHHHGGAYLDIKREYGDVLAAVNSLNASPQHWMMSFRELGPHTVAPEQGEVGAALRRHYRLLLAMCAFAAKPGSPLTHEWLAEVHRRLDHYSPALRASPGNALGDNDGYPIPWTAILGGVLHPLCLKYPERLMMDDAFRPSFRDYR
ncbi:glycosyltransferase [Nocardioides baculatus]|uniref:Capsular polysaccharide synthesis protein n=1 Tax=Nocardioides baculatus TaxID=2801337 RepID=A0ABS1LBT1_9ACTN|nr:glycosyltransferase [Nocardioides baculatus]MBL0749129.1 hypothetical protein [Nocardioides baculatus]